MDEMKYNNDELFHFIEAIMKNRSLVDAKKREQFAILKKQMELDLQVNMLVIC